MAQIPAIPAQPPKRFLPALVTAPESTRIAGSSNMDATPSQVQAFEEYKRRHSKQNRDIIKTNADRAMRIRNLEDENTHLQMEIINIRHEKSIVAEELRREKERANKIRNNPEVKQALDVLLLAIPQITQLRSFLSSSSPSSSSRRTTSQPSSSSTDPSDGRSTNTRTRSRGLEPATKKIEVQTWLNRPAIVKAGKPSLENLAEGIEEAGDDLKQVELLVEAAVPVERTRTANPSLITTSSKPIAAKPAGRRQSSLFRPVANESSNPFDPSNTGPSGMSLPSDIFDVRKSPKKRAESEISGPSTKSITTEPFRRSPRKKAARMNYAEDTQDDEIIAVETVRGKDKAGVSPTKAVVRKRRSLKPVECGLALRLETAAEVAESVIEAETKISVDDRDEPKTRATREATPPIQVAAVHEQTLMRMAKAATGPPVAPIVVVTTSRPSELEIREEEETGGRQRRARKSVNYKEPNLHFKMRKPESISSGQLYVSGPSTTSGTMRARSTTPSNTPGRKTLSHSVLDDSEVLNVPVIPAGLRGEAGLKGGDEQYGLSNLEPVNAGVMRRKSVLPKSRRVEALSENGQGEMGGASDNELPILKEQMGTLGGEIEKISSRRRARLGTPEASNVDSPSRRQPLQPILNSSQSSTDSAPDTVKLDDGLARRARRRSTMFQTTIGEA